ncbi:HDOD domain-containing protein [Maridesulfovibrio sp. FT414]|uniref:HDOD domain-containing protein n=1 Tax=Maridesulfovibrio sp. FT414 TaxID=2979469 RepID=UPI003D804293
MKVFIADLKPGMQLAADVKGSNGRLLLPGGTVLEDQHLRVFNIWGVSEVEIYAGAGVDAGDGENGADDAFLELAAEHAEVLFRHADMSIDPMPAFRQACVKSYAKKLAESGKLPAEPALNEKGAEIPSSPLFADAGAFLDSGVRLSSFPDIYYKIMDALNNPSSTSSTLADIISKDSGLSARLISLVNSPLYGFSNHVESLSRAVSLVGTSGLSQLALSVSVMDSFRGLDSKYFSMADFWKHSLSCAVFCRILSSQEPGTSQDTCFVVGMLHDLGRLVMLQQAPEETLRVFMIARHHGVSPCEAERMVFGFDHCDLSQELFRLWNFPHSLISGVAGHHGGAGKNLSMESAICSIGDLMAIGMQYGSNGVEYVHAPYPGAWDILNLQEGAIATTMLKAQRQIADILTIFGG